MNALTALALAAIVLGLIGLVLLASTAPLPVTFAVIAVFCSLYLTKDMRR
jgi:hypothetical protein